MAYFNRRCAAAALLSTAASAAVMAHPDDPKALDTMPPYVGPGYRAAQGGIAGAPDFPASGLTLLAWLPVGEFDESLTWANDCWGYVSPSGREYAIIGLSAATGFVEVTDPGDPVILAVIPGPSSTWRDIKVHQDHAYAVSEDGAGIQVIDLGEIDDGVVTLTGSVLTGGTPATHNVAINEDSGFLYRTGGGNLGLRIYDLSDPANPVYVSAWTDRYVHDAQIVSYPDGIYAGREIAFCCAGYNGGWDQTGLTILDVTDKQNIVELAHLLYPENAYSHQGWLSADRQYFYLGDELDESDFNVNSTMHIIEVADLENPVYRGAFTNGSTAITHNLYTLGNLIYAANYRSGLRVFDGTDPLAPVEIAYFDTFPEDDAKTYNGLWSSYPYFPSGTIVGSDREKGLFVWQAGPAPLAFTYPEGLPDVIDEAGQTVLVQIAEQGSASLDPATAALHYDDGSGYATAPLVEVGPGLFEAAFPPVACGTTVSFYLSAQTTGGVTIADPGGAPDTAYSAFAAAGVATSFEDDFESDQGWVTENLGAVSGDWQRGVPVNDPGWQYDPEADGDGSGQCYLTQNEAGNTDVDGGAVRLTSPVLDLTGDNVTLAYAYYLFKNDGNDVLLVEISPNGDAGPWVPVATHVTSGGTTWRHHEITGAEIESAGAALTGTMKLRFTVNDADPQSIVEAGIDGVGVVDVTCGGVPGDIDGDGTVGVNDFLLLLADWGTCDDPCPPTCPADLDGDCAVGVNDFLQLLANWS